MLIGMSSSLQPASSSPSSSLSSSPDDGQQYMLQQQSSTFVAEMEKKYLSTQEFDDQFFVKLLAGTDPCKLASERGLELIVLNFKAIETIGCSISFMSFCENAREVDVAWNKLSSWSEIAILLTLPNLRLLNIGYNLLNDRIDGSLPVSMTMEVLILNGTCLPMSTICQVVNKMPKLSQLYLSENRHVEEKLDVKTSIVSKSVDTLHLSQCDIVAWETVIAFHKYFPSCTTMVLCDNPISSIACEQNQNMHLLSGVRCLSMNNCLIDDWSAIERLANIKSLRELRIAMVPLLKTCPSEDNFHLIVGRIPQLEILNGSIINDKQREESERFLIRYYDLCETKPSIFGYLIERHGHVEPLCQVDMTPKMSATVSVICDEIGYRGSVEIRLSETVGSLMHQMEELTNIASSCMRLFVISASSGNPFTEELKVPSRKLATLRIEDGDEVIVQSKIVTRRKDVTMKK